jgi:hypothetical protein
MSTRPDGNGFLGSGIAEGLTGVSCRSSVGWVTRTASVPCEGACSGRQAIRQIARSKTEEVFKKKRLLMRYGQHKMGAAIPSSS